MEGLVLKSTGSWYTVQTDQGIKNARIRGKFRTKGLKTTNPIAVGDNVILDIKDEDAIITAIHPRKNYIIRKSINLSKRAHILAANVDRAYLMVTMTSPQTLLGFVDRFLVGAEAYHIPVTLLFNKVDIYDDEAKTIMEEWKSIYEPIGYPCYAISALNAKNITFLQNEINNHKVIISGNSGVGKSTLINALDHQLDIKTNIISDYHKTGQHTTTFAEMHELQTGGYIIDTPGIRGFGVYDLDKNNLSHQFPEMREILSGCKFNNCIHDNEPDCAIKDAVGEGIIAGSRYLNYLSILEEQDQSQYRKDIYG